MMTAQQGILAGILALAALIWSWISRGRKVNDLTQELKIQPGQIEIARTQKELDVQRKEAEQKAADYQSLVASNPELTAKLGIGNKPNP